MRGTYYSLETKKQAEFLRSQNKTYKEIKDILGIPKSTLSLWVGEKYAHIFDRRAQLIHLAKIREMSAKTTRLRVETRDKETRLNAIKEFKKFKINKLTEKLSLALLYWAEGTKSPNLSGLIFTNTDPLIIKLFVTMLRNAYSIDESGFRVRIYVHHYHKKKELVQFWSDLLKIPKEQFAPLLVKPRSKKRRFRKNPKGICFVRYRDSNIRREILAIARIFAEKVIGLRYSMNSIETQKFVASIAR